jgi:hypothetical protein
MYNETVQRLEKFSDPTEFERLCSDLLSRIGYRFIEPQGVGKKDGGKDALHFADENKTVIHMSLREDWEKKILEDLETTRENGGKYTKFVFVSNRCIPPIKRDHIKAMIKSDYGWEPEIIDQERLRVELDNHSLDLRKKYLGISESYRSVVMDAIQEFVDERDELASGIMHSRYRRILLLSIPNNLESDRMKLFDQKLKFRGNVDKLKEVLGQNLPTSDFTWKNTSTSFSTNYTVKPKHNYMTISISETDHPYESNLHNNGIIEIMFDAYIGINVGMIMWMLKGLFNSIKQLYEDRIDGEEYVTVAVCFINARLIEYKKSDEVVYYGESYNFFHVDEDNYRSIIESDFQNNFAETLLNKLDNFFNKTSLR